MGSSPPAYPSRALLALLSATLAFEAGNLGLLPLHMGFGKRPQALKFPWLKGGGEQGDSAGGGLGRDRNCRGWDSGTGHRWLRGGGFQEMG